MCGGGVLAARFVSTPSPIIGGSGSPGNNSRSSKTERLDLDCSGDRLSSQDDDGDVADQKNTAKAATRDRSPPTTIPNPVRGE